MTRERGCAIYVWIYFAVDFEHELDGCRLRDRGTARTPGGRSQFVDCGWLRDCAYLELLGIV